MLSVFAVSVGEGVGVAGTAVSLLDSGVFCGFAVEATCVSGFSVSAGGSSCGLLMAAVLLCALLSEGVVDGVDIAAIPVKNRNTIPMMHNTGIINGFFGFGVLLPFKLTPARDHSLPHFKHL